MVNLVFLIAVNTAVFFLLGIPIAFFVGFLLITSIGAIPLFLIGITIGIISRNQMSTGILSAPVMFLFLFPAILSAFNPVMGLVAQYTPISNILTLCFALINGKPLFSSATLLSYVVLLGWTAISALLCALAYRRKRLD